VLPREFVQELLAAKAACPRHSERLLGDLELVTPFVTLWDRPREASVVGNRAASSDLVTYLPEPDERKPRDQRMP
jgi:hypothetical protein